MATFEPKLTIVRFFSCLARSGSGVAIRLFHCIAEQLFHIIVVRLFHIIVVQLFHFIYTEGSQYAFQESQDSFQMLPDPVPTLHEKRSLLGTVARAAAAATRTVLWCVMIQVWTEPSATL